ncbi:MAG: rod shape-determining protein MreD [Muribaculaceae bacterium]|nr:rod shape-determining protein MreD [Muribaculaceae bacterium]
MLFIVLILCQAIIFNNLVLWNTAVAFVFLYLIVELPITISTNAMLTIGFVLGLSVDVFQDTAGLNALTCTICCFLRKPLYHLYVPGDEDYAGRRLCIATMGALNYFKYMVTLVLLYSTVYFLVESVGHAPITRLMTRILASAAFTLTVIYAIDSLTLARREKRL